MTNHSRMRAVQYQQYGGPDVLESVELPIPECAEDEVLVRVRYTTVNRTDCGFLRGRPAIVRLFAGLTKPNDTVLGCEFSGEVVSIGRLANEFKPGDRVCGFKDDDFGFGGHAQYTTMNMNGLITKIPDQLTFAEAAPSLEGSHYALFGIRATGVKAGHDVLVNGGTGAIGSATIQIIKSMGANITAVCGPDHIDTVKQLGASRAIDFMSEDFTQLGQQFDVVYDAVGKSTFGRCKNILKPNGKYISTELGPYVQNPFLALYTKFFSQKKVMFPIPKNDKADADYLGSLLKTNQYKPLIDRAFVLDDIVEAFHYVETGEKIGNVIIEMP